MSQAVVYGNFPLIDFLRADAIERRVLLEFAESLIEVGIERDHLLANRIIYELSEATKK